HAPPAWPRTTPRPRIRPGLPGLAEPARYRRSCWSGRRRPPGRRRRSDGRSRLRQRLLEVRPEHVHVLEPDAQAEQIFWNPAALPAATALQYRVDAAKAGRVGDLLQRRFDLSRVPADIEREHAAEA